MEEIIEHFKQQLDVKKSLLEVVQKEIAKLEKFISELERTNSDPPI